MATVSTAKYHTTDMNPIYRFQYCDDCKEVTLPRAYHCDACGRCVIRMDHHCPWVGTCIGLLNYKFYWLFLLYSCILLLILTLTVIIGGGNWILAVVSAILFIDFLVLFSIQTNNVLHNKTAVDSKHLTGEYDIYRDKSKRENWEQVFTSNILFWILPLGKPDIRQGLDYGANIPVGGLMRKPEQTLPIKLKF